MKVETWQKLLHLGKYLILSSFQGILKGAFINKNTHLEEIAEFQ